MITVRESKASEDSTIGELLVQSFVEMYEKKMPEVVVHDRRKKDLRDVATRRLSETVCVLVATKMSEDGETEELLGTVTLLKPEDPNAKPWIPNTANLKYLAVGLDARGQGVSKLLLDASVKKAREWGVDGICLHVRRGADGVAGVYTGYGFRRSPEGDQDQRPEIFLDAYLLKLE